MFVTLNVENTTPDHVPVDLLAARGRRVLCRHNDHRPFAYARGQDFIRISDHAVWAHLHNGRLLSARLLSARSGALLAYQNDELFYDAETHQPIYYQSPRPMNGNLT